MKRALASILVFTTVLLLLHALLSSCRSVKRDKSRADSTSVSSMVVTRSFSDESMTELTIESDELALIGPGLSLPQLLGFAPHVAGIAPAEGAADSVAEKKPPAKRKGYTRITLRTTAKSAGTAKKKEIRYNQVSTAARVSTKQPNPWSWPSIILVVAGVLAIAAILRQTKQS